MEWEREWERHREWERPWNRTGAGTGSRRGDRAAGRDPEQDSDHRDTVRLSHLPWLHFTPKSSPFGLFIKSPPHAAAGQGLCFGSVLGAPSHGCHVDTPTPGLPSRGSPSPWGGVCAVPAPPRGGPCRGGLSPPKMGQSGVAAPCPGGSGGNVVLVLVLSRLWEPHAGLLLPLVRLKQQKTSGGAGSRARCGRSAWSS